MAATKLKAIIVNRSRYRILIFGRVPHKIFSQFAQNTVECVLKTLLTFAINGLHCESNIADGPPQVLQLICGSISVSAILAARSPGHLVRSARATPLAPRRPAP